ncbi:MAG: hypothetical protein ACYC33_11680, partial [Thermoleophilia bacterium]
PFFSGFCAVSQLTFSQERGHLSAICYLIAAVWTGGSGLIYTARDLQPFAIDCGYSGPSFVWDEGRRLLLRSELDAAFFHIYGIRRDDVDYIMETFPIVKRKAVAEYGTYRTKDLILDAFDRMAHAVETGEPYRTTLDPPPGVAGP